MEDILYIIKDMVIGRLGGGVQEGMEDKEGIRVCGVPLSFLPSLPIPPTFLDSMCISSNFTTFFKIKNILLIPFQLLLLSVSCPDPFNIFSNIKNKF